MAVTSDGSGGAIQRQFFDPWGAIKQGGAPGVTTNFTGQRRDDTGLLFYNARYYDPVIGRFLSADTIVPGAGRLTLTPSDATAAGMWGAGGGGPQNPQELNRYAYALNNPLRYTDPTGHCVDGLTTTWCVIGGAAAAATAPAWVGPALVVAGVIALGAGIAYVASEVINNGDQANSDQATSVPESSPVAPDETPASTPTGGTYVLKDPDTGAVVRSGRTRDLERRQDEHARDPQLRDYDFEEDARTDNYAEQRGREQYLHDKYNPPLNKIRPISPNNPRRQEYINAAKNVRGQQ